MKGIEMSEKREKLIEFANRELCSADSFLNAARGFIEQIEGIPDSIESRLHNLALQVNKTAKSISKKLDKFVVDEAKASEKAIAKASKIEKMKAKMAKMQATLNILEN